MRCRDLTRTSFCPWGREAGTHTRSPHRFTTHPSPPVLLAQSQHALTYDASTTAAFTATTMTATTAITTTTDRHTRGGALACLHICHFPRRSFICSLVFLATFNLKVFGLRNDMPPACLPLYSNRRSTVLQLWQAGTINQVHLSMSLKDFWMCAPTVASFSQPRKRHLPGSCLAFFCHSLSQLPPGGLCGELPRTWQ